jgi:hypothetical protein
MTPTEALTHLTAPLPANPALDTPRIEATGG